MKILSKILLISLACFTLPSHAWWLKSTNSSVDISEKKDEAHNQWLKERFSKQHEQLIPIVAVADMFFSCNQARKTDDEKYEISYLVNEMDKNTLAEKLGNCLGDDTMQSNVALNFGLLGCFQQQLAHLPEEERDQKMHVVKKTMSSLSYDERKKSFTQCVTEQSIHYLK